MAERGTYENNFTYGYCDCRIWLISGNCRFLYEEERYEDDCEESNGQICNEGSYRAYHRREHIHIYELLYLFKDERLHLETVTELWEVANKIGIEICKRNGNSLGNIFDISFGDIVCNTADNRENIGSQ